MTQDRVFNATTSRPEREDAGVTYSAGERYAAALGTFAGTCKELITAAEQVRQSARAGSDWGRLATALAQAQAALEALEAARP